MPAASPALLGDSIGANLIMLGFAWQKGWCRSRPRRCWAIELNGVAIELQQARLSLGARAAHRPRRRGGRRQAEGGG
jgi:indolepyruvate ferredoxin oxidoreductase